ncbi:hypothetical protein CRG98_010703 [Punica granatum]|uniref:Uncharacterized protein n=1 Tax=Punica granatum TaxID=22663 RepID=A0A2I0KKR8_PUNGR|nr:hypothetical protein CRG98_010703 [Punica granatum]
MHEEKSRGSSLESRETRLEATGQGTREVAAAATRKEWGRHASSGHGTVQVSERTVKEKNPVKEKTMKRWLCTVDRPSDRDHSSRGRVRVLRNPLSVMARLAKVVGRNGTCRGLGAHSVMSKDPIALVAGT